MSRNFVQILYSAGTEHLEGNVSRQWPRTALYGAGGWRAEQDRHHTLTRSFELINNRDGFKGRKAAQKY